MLKEILSRYGETEAHTLRFSYVTLLSFSVCVADEYYKCELSLVVCAFP